MMPRTSWSRKHQVRQRAFLSVEGLERRTLLSTISPGAYALLNDRVSANEAAFYVYQDGDAGANHGFASGKFASANDPTIINGSRRLRIANGAGTTTTSVNQLVKQFQEAQKMFRAAGLGPRLNKARAKSNRRKKGRSR